MRLLSCLLFMLALAGAVAPRGGAEEEAELAPVPHPPELPDPLKSGRAIEPQITIIRKDDAVIEEYRLNGRLYMTRVTPAAGPAYYLVDRDGDGRMESRMSGLRDDVPVPQWVLFSW